MTREELDAWTVDYVARAGSSVRVAPAGRASIERYLTANPASELRAELLRKCSVIDFVTARKSRSAEVEEVELEPKPVFTEGKKQGALFDAGPEKPKKRGKRK